MQSLTDSELEMLVADLAYGLDLPGEWSPGELSEASARLALMAQQIDDHLDAISEANYEARYVAAQPAGCDGPPPDPFDGDPELARDELHVHTNHVYTGVRAGTGSGV